MPEAFVGFYWTRPVTLIGFRTLPNNAEEAAASSKTVKYQKERVRRHVQEIGGSLVAEVPFLDTQPDRSTNAIRDALLKVQKLCADHNATMAYVNFQEVAGGRRNSWLLRGIEELGIRAESLSPDPLALDGKLFDPIRHFRSWSQKHGEIANQLEQCALAGLKSANAEIELGQGRYRKIAEWLNQEGIRTFEGRKWTDENVRKAIKGYGIDQ